MNCREFEQHLQGVLDGLGEPEPAEVRAHREACAVCRELALAAKQLRRGLALLPVPATPEGFADRVKARVLLRPRRLPATRWWLAAAASLLVAGLATVALWDLLDWFPKGGTSPRTPRFVEAQKLPSLRQEVAAAGSATRDLTRSLARDAVDHAGILVPPAERLPATAWSPSWSPGLSPGLETEVAPLRQAGRTVASGLEPVTHSARRAWDMFVRELPLSDPGTPQ